MDAENETTSTSSLSPRGRRRRRIVLSSAVAIAIVPVVYVAVALTHGVTTPVDGMATVLFAPLATATVAAVTYRRMSDDRGASWTFAVSFVGGVLLARGMHLVVGGTEGITALL